MSVNERQGSVLLLADGPRFEHVDLAGRSQHYSNFPTRPGNRARALGRARGSAVMRVLRLPRPVDAGGDGPMLAGVSTRRFSSRMSVYPGAFQRSAKHHPPVELRHAYHPRMNDVDRPRQPELDHLGLSVADLARSEEFYCDVLGANVIFPRHELD